MMPASFDISQLPSLQDGMSIQEESMKRRKTCRFIEEAGRILKLPRVAIATAMVFFHRFYAKHSFAQHDRFEVAVACLLLAAKTEESPKKLVVVLEECQKLKWRGMQAGSATVKPPDLDPKGEEFSKLKERVLLLERVILHTIGFELSIDHPYKFLVEQIKQLVQGKKLIYQNNHTPVGLSSPQQQQQHMMNEMVQLAMNFANDSMHTSLCLQFDPKKIAFTCVYLAAQFGHLVPTNESDDWCDSLLSIDSVSLASIALQLIELIAERKGSDPTVLNQVKEQLEVWTTLEPQTKRPRVE
ncbi:cyclin T [Fistulifera solaris]|uniref:Cyclin T n=1 Tax=Fistulifera solaris TaxID=1519565 RepID=A0A1Z5JVR7_FISSO|nr:cyclin T [Fistulifera solaris]|eukprot:GAX18019.1 cyclin T [Fistulifera solaris]